MKREDIERHNALYAGGTQKIYISDNWTVSAPMDEVLQTIDYLRQMSEQDRPRCVASVRRSMDEAHPKMITHIATQSEAMDYMQDATIWFANEVIEGRATVSHTSGSALE